MVSDIESPALPPSSISGERKGKRSIKLLSCIIRGEKLDVVTNSLNRLNLVGGMTVTDVRGVGSGKEEPEIYRGARYLNTYVERVKVELVIEANDLNEVERLIKEIAQTGEVGDGKLFIVTVTEMMRIRTGERGASAL